MSTAAANGYTWNYKLSGGNASIGTGFAQPGTATTSGTAIDGAIIIPSILAGYPVTSISGYAFFTCNRITSVTIPDSVTSFGFATFYQCSGLKSLTISKNLTTIPDSVFNRCSGLTSVTIPDKVTSIGSAAFIYCSGLTSINIPDSVTSIATDAFTNGSTALTVTMNTKTIDGTTYTSPTTTDITFFGNPSVTLVLPPPTMTITSTTVANNAITTNASIALTFTSSASTSDFVVGDISLTNGSLSAFAGSGSVYTATFAPTSQGVCTINVLANKFTAGGVNNTASNIFTFNFDAAPTMAITSTIASGSTSNIASIPLTFTASESITGFQAGDISFNRGSLTAFGGSGSVYTATFTPTIQGAYTINVPVGAYIDASGNSNTAASAFNWTYDSIQPTMDISSSTFCVTSGSTTNNSTIALTFTSSKPTNDFLVGDISFNKGSLAGFTGIVTEGTEGTVYTATFTQGGQGAHTIYVPVAAYIDAAGNSNTASNIFNWTYDSISPSMDISATTLGVTRGSTTKTTPIELTFTSTEATNNFGEGDISFNNGTLSDFASISPTVYTATFTPTSQGLCTIDVAAGAYTDAATNLNNLATQFSFTYDTVPPSMTITSTAVTSGSTTDNETIALTFTSSEATNDFVVGDISVTNGTLSDFDGSGSVYTATFTPTSEGACTINVAAGAYTDVVGYGNSASNMFSFGYILKFAYFNDANNLEQTYITGFLDVSGTINHRSGDLNVIDGNLIVRAGDVSLNNGNLYVGGNGFINSNLNVAGATTLMRVSVSQTIDVSGASALNGALSVSGLTSFNNNVSVSGNKTFTVGTGATAMGGNVTMNSTLAVAGAVSMNSGLRVAGATTLANTIIGGPVSVSERAVFLNDISFTGTNVDIIGNLRAQYPANSIPAAAIIGGFNIVSLFNADLSLNKTLSVGGATSLSTLAATSNAILRSTAAITGATIMSTLTTSGATTFGSTLSVVGKAALMNDVSFNGSQIDICGNLYANYPVNSIPLSAVVGGLNPVFNTDVSVNAMLSVAGATTLKSTLVVSGKTTFENNVSFATSYSRIDICGNLYANYPENSIPSSAIIGGATLASTFNTDVSMNSRLYVKDSIKIGNLATISINSGQLSTAVLSTSGLQTSGSATVSGPLAVTGATTLSTMTISGAASMNTLNVTGSTTLSTMTVSGNASVGGTLLVTGTSSIGVATMNSTLSVGAATTISTKLVVNSDVSLNNKLIIGGATTMNSTLTVAGATTLNNAAFMTSLETAGAVTTNTTLYVAKSVTMNGDLDTSGVLLISAVTMPTTLTVAGAAVLSSKLSVAGATIMKSTLNTSGAVTIGGILSVAGITMSGASNMNGKVSVGSDVSMNSTLIVMNNATLASTLAVLGATTLSSTLYTSGSTTINTLNVTGKTTFLNDISFNNNVTIPNNLNMNNNLITIGSSNIQYNAGIDVDTAFIPSSMYTTNNATVGGILTIVGGTTLSSTLTVVGATTSATMHAGNDATIGSTLSVTGAATVGPLTVSGATTTSALTTTGATTIGGTLGIAGAATMTTLNLYGPVRQW